MKLAICDDDRRIREMIAEAVREVSDSVEIEFFKDTGGVLVKSFDADILFLDIQMPGIDGMKAARMIRAKGETVSDATYSINRMSQSERDSIVERMKADAEERKEQLVSLVQKTLSGQISVYGKASEDNIWQVLSGGNFTVDAATRAQAQKDISEDGYWGVKQTSKRLFDFASALAGDDVDRMKKMQEAMEKGFKLATKAWGRELPSISQQTLEAANRLFEEYYKSKEDVE